MSMKNSNDTIGNRTRDLPTCSAVPQITAPPRAPIDLKGVEDFHICSCFDGCIEEEDFTNHAPPGTSNTKHQPSLNEGVLHVSLHYRHIPFHFSHNERTPVQISL
jgi:hypothetical protein